MWHVHVILKSARVLIQQLQYISVRVLYRFCDISESNSLELNCQNLTHTHKNPIMSLFADDVLFSKCTVYTHGECVCVHLLYICQLPTSPLGILFDAGSGSRLELGLCWHIKWLVLYCAAGCLWLAHPEGLPRCLTLARPLPLASTLHLELSL